MIKREDGLPVPRARVFLVFSKEDPPPDPPNVFRMGDSISIEWDFFFQNTMEAGKRVPDDALTTGEDGRFEFTVKPGRYAVWAEHSDYGFAASPKVGVKAGADTELELTMGPSFSISGRVREESGAGVAELFVAASAVEGSGSRRTLVAKTAAGGRYVIPNLAAGSYRVSISEGQPSSFHWFGSRDQDFYEAHPPAEVTAGSNGVDFMLRRRSIVSGTVSGAAKYHVVADYVTDGLVVGRGTAGNWQFDRPEFTLRLHRPGRIVLWAVSTEGSSAVLGPISVGSDASPAPVALAIRPGRTLRGTVHDHQGAPLVGARLDVQRVTASEGRSTWSGYWNAESKAHGRFEIRGVPEGIAELKASHGEHGDLVVRVPPQNADVILVLPRKP